jgi:hypothetical protein
MVSSVAGGADPGRGAERFSERLLCREPAANQLFRIRVLRDVAWGPSVKTGANVPSYSGGFAASWWFRIRCLKNVAKRPWFLLSLGALTPEPLAVGAGKQDSNGAARVFLV